LGKAKILNQEKGGGQEENVTKLKIENKKKIFTRFII